MRTAEQTVRQIIRRDLGITEAKRGVREALSKQVIDLAQKASQVYGDGPDRDLDWRSPITVDYHNWYYVMRAALEPYGGGYNEFNIDRVVRVIKRYPHLQYRPARESSVGLYATGFRDGQEALQFCLDMRLKAKADETGNDKIGHHVEDPNMRPGYAQTAEEFLSKWKNGSEIRIWWD